MLTVVDKFNLTSGSRTNIFVAVITISFISKPESCYEAYTIDAFYFDMNV